MENSLFLEDLTIGQYCSIFNENVVLNEEFTLAKYNKQIKRYQASMTQCKIQLGKAGIDVKEFTKEIQKLSSETVDEVKKQKMNKEGLKKASSIISRAIISIKNLVVRLVNKIIERLGNTYVVQLVIFAMIYAINTAVDTMLLAMFGPTGLIISAIVTGPLIEESIKLLSVKLTGGKSGKLNIIINTYETVRYGSRILKSGGTVASVIGVRLPIIIMHTLTGLIAGDKYEQDREEGKSKLKAGNGSLIVTTIIHGVFNALYMLI